jgi:hypothetical protein
MPLWSGRYVPSTSRIFPAQRGILASPRLSPAPPVGGSRLRRTVLGGPSGIPRHSTSVSPHRRRSTRRQTAFHDGPHHVPRPGAAPMDGNAESAGHRSCSHTPRRRDMRTIPGTRIGTTQGTTLRHRSGPVGAACGVETCDSLPVRPGRGALAAPVVVVQLMRPPAVLTPATSPLGVLSPPQHHIPAAPIATTGLGEAGARRPVRA